MQSVLFELANISARVKILITRAEITVVAVFIDRMFCINPIFKHVDKKRLQLPLCRDGGEFDDSEIDSIL